MYLKRINSIDVLRLIAMFAIVCIHSNDFVFFWNVLPLTRIAVPIFFLISGYFFCTSNKDKQKKQMKKILILLILSNAFYFIIHLLGEIVDHSLTAYITDTFSFQNIIKFFVFNFSPFNEHLWFLSALLYCMLIVYFIQKFANDKFSSKKKFVSLLVISAVLLIIGFVVMMMFSKNKLLYRNFLFFGLPYFIIGKLFRQYNTTRIEKINNTAFFIVMLILCLITYMEMHLFGNHEWFFVTPFFVVTVFAFTLKHKLTNPSQFGKLISKCGRQYTLPIYIFHPFFIIVCAGLAKKIGGTVFTLYTYTEPIIIFVATLVFSMLLMAVLNIKNKLRK